MSTFRATCPYCTQVERLKISTSIKYYSASNYPPWLKIINGEVFQRIIPESIYSAHNAECFHCGGICIIVFYLINESDLKILDLSIRDKTVYALDGSKFLKFIKIFPQLKNKLLRGIIPENASLLFEEAKQDLSANRQPAGIIAKCRSILDVCLKELKANGKNRKDKIKNLQEMGILTKSLGEWADILWEDGNDIDQAGRHIKFLELFFEVAFALPKQIEQSQESL